MFVCLKDPYELMSRQPDSLSNSTPIDITHSVTRAPNVMSLIGIADISIATTAAV